MNTRACGDCTLCCRLLPVREIDKPAGERCEHQCRRGCRVYDTADMPMSCRLWSCGWLLGHDLRRPDRAHYVVDCMPDFVTIVNSITGEREPVPVVQVWIDPKFPDAHRDPALRRYLAMRGERDGAAALIRHNNRDAWALFPPALSADGEWHEVHTNFHPEQQHTAADVAAVLKAHGLRMKITLEP